MILPILRQGVDDLIHLFYPNLCLACGRHLPAREEVICLRCAFQLPQTRFHLEKENPFTERFWGRLPLESGAALFHYVKGGRVQQLIHQLKYKGKREVGYRLGLWYGRQLREAPYFSGVDLILPVPLHSRKAHVRGFNQSALFAKGLAEAMDKPWEPKILRRLVFTQTQTRKSRLQRLENVLSAFELSTPGYIRDRHLLLVDDVMTTGATLEACGLQLLRAPGVRLSMATIAMAVD